MSVPNYYQPIMPYIVVSDADAFIDFIKRVFDAEERLVVRNPDETISHAEFSLNGGTILFGQSSEMWPPFPCAMYLVTQSVDQIYERGLANGAVGNQEPGDRGYGQSAGFMDKFGNQWWLNWPDHG